MRLTNLPPEVLDIISSFLDTSISESSKSPAQSSLVALRETCTIMASITARHLFRHVHFLQGEHVQFIKFCRVIIGQAPALSEHVRSLHAPFLYADVLAPYDNDEPFAPAFKRLLHRALRLMTNLTELHLYLDEFDVPNLLQCQFSLRCLMILSFSNQTPLFFARQPLLETLSYVRLPGVSTSTPTIDLQPDCLPNIKVISGTWPDLLSIVSSRPVTTCELKIISHTSDELQTRILPILKQSAGPLETLDIACLPDDYAMSFMITLKALPQLLHLTMRIHGHPLTEVLWTVYDDGLWNSMRGANLQLQLLSIFVADARPDYGGAPSNADISTFTSRLVNRFPSLAKIEFREFRNHLNPFEARTSFVQISRPASGGEATWTRRTTTTD